MFRLVHIINPTNVSQSTDLYKAQPITIESILKAKEFCKESDSVFLKYTHFVEEQIHLPKPFENLSFLSSSIHDILEESQGAKLPLLAEILNKAADVDADYVVYTNMDIGLLPHFYDYIVEYLSLGHDAIVINRRRLSKKYFEDTSLAQMYSDIGFSHPGFDCFVIHKRLIGTFDMADICIGIPFVEATLLYNIAAHANNPLYIADGHLTFHIGLDVMPPRHKLYYQHNRTVFFKKILPKLLPKLNIKKLPYAALPLPLRAIKWMLNPTMFTRLYVLLELKSMSAYLNEIRWRILQR